MKVRLARKKDQYFNSTSARIKSSGVLSYEPFAAKKI